MAVVFTLRTEKKKKKARKQTKKIPISPRRISLSLSTGGIVKWHFLVPL